MRARAVISIIATSALLAALGCTSRMEADKIKDASALVNQQHFKLMVQCEDKRLEPYIYEDAWRVIGSVLPLTEGEDATGTVEVTFTSDTGNAAIGTGIGVGHASGGGWYSGGHMSSVGIGLSGAGDITWQNSLMMVVVKGSGEQRLWSARYQHRGNVGFGGAGGRGAAAARTCLDAIATRLRQSLATAPGARNAAKPQQER